jgi:hypothetical protein
MTVADLSTTSLKTTSKTSLVDLEMPPLVSHRARMERRE